MCSGFFSLTESRKALAGYYEISWMSAVRSTVFAFTGHDAIVLTPVWSLRLEVGLYIFAALIAAIYMTGGASCVICSTCFTIFIGLYFWRLSYASTSVLTFGLGALLAFWHSEKPYSKGKPSPIIKLMALTGSYFYTLYLVHMPVILVVASSVANRSLAFILSVLGANLFSFLVALIFERPSQYAAMIRMIGRQRVVQAE